MIGYNGSVLHVSGNWLNEVDYNPLNLPPYTLRIEFSPGTDPRFDPYTKVHSWTQVSASPNVWDMTYHNPDWSNMFYASPSTAIKVLGGNTSGVTNMVNMFSRSSFTEIALFDTRGITSMEGMFEFCHDLTTIPRFNTSSVTNFSHAFMGTAITEIPLMDTSHVTNFEYAFDECESLIHVPLLNTSSALYVTAMFNGCGAVESGALALYNQMSSQANPPSHSHCFSGCGINTVTGAAELAQIPQSWGGTAT